MWVLTVEMLSVGLTSQSGGGGSLLWVLTVEMLSRWTNPGELWERKSVVGTKVNTNGKSATPGFATAWGAPYLTTFSSREMWEFTNFDRSIPNRPVGFGEGHFSVA